MSNIDKFRNLSHQETLTDYAWKAFRSLISPSAAIQPVRRLVRKTLGGGGGDPNIRRTWDEKEATRWKTDLGDAM